MFSMPLQENLPKKMQTIQATILLHLQIQTRDQHLWQYNPPNINILLTS